MDFVKKMRMSLRLTLSAVGVVATLVLAACEPGEADAGQDAPAATPAMATVSAEAAIAERIADYIDVLTTQRNASVAADFYTDDARLLGPGIDLDRQRIVDGIQAVMSAGTEVEVNRETLELFVHDDAAYEIARAEDVFVSADGQTADTVRNNLFIRWERDSDGMWRFDRVVLGPQGQN